MPQQTSIRIASELLEALDVHRPTWKTLPRFVEDQLEKVIIGLDSTSTLNVPSRQAPGPTQGGGSLNKKKDVKNSVLAEEAHIDAEELKAAKRKPVKDRTIPEALAPYEALIRDWWAVKPKTKTNAAWSLNMTQLTKLLNQYGDSVVRDQLVQAEAFRWQGISVRNYERYGMDTPKKPWETEAPNNHPAQKVFKASDLGPEWERNAPPSMTDGKGVLEGMF